MTFKDLANLINYNNQQKSSNLDFSPLWSYDPNGSSSNYLPFWIWDSKEIHKQKYKESKGNCCFNHVLGLPSKHGIEKPLFDYQHIIYQALQTSRHIWIKKATGLGITEFFLRYMCYLALCSNSATKQNDQMVIVTGPNMDLAIKLIRRMKNLFANKLQIYFDSKETVLELQNTRIEAYPSNHIDSFRSLDNPSFILLDEADFFRKGEQEDVRAVAERYIAKSNPYIVMISTPNAPGGLFEQIEQEPNSLYKKIKLDYRYGLGKIYTREEIEKAKQSPSFEREYDLKYLGKIGNLYSQFSINVCVQNGDYDPDSFNPYTEKYMAIDEGYSSSKFAIIIVEFSRNKKKQIRVLYAEEINRPLYEEALDTILQLRKKYGNIQNIAFDASRPEFGLSLKKKIDENYNWQYIQDKISYCRKHNLDLARYMVVVPILFTRESREIMTSHSRRILDDPRGLLAINQNKFPKLVTALRSAQFDDSGKLDKEESPHNDLLDVFQMICTFFKYNTKE